jgi:antitoxin component HigA of HigAB toxin-antitoxin module
MSYKPPAGKRTVNNEKYSRLLGEARPTLPRTVRENGRLTGILRRLIDKGQSRSPEESALAEVLVALIFQFEQEHYKPPKLEPHELLQAIVEERGLTQRDLLDIFPSRPLLSRVLAGKTDITAAQATALGRRFRMNPSFFISHPAKVF